MELKKILSAALLIVSVACAARAAEPPDSIGVKKVQGKNFLIHRIETSEGWFSIARHYGVSYAELRMANKDSADKLIPGRTLLVPLDKLKANDPFFSKNYIQEDELYYFVKDGETMFSIAKKFYTSVDSLKKWNRLSDSDVKSGQHLKVGFRSRLDGKEPDTTLAKIEKKPELPKRDSLVQKKKTETPEEKKDKTAVTKRDTASVKTEKKPELSKRDSLVVKKKSVPSEEKKDVAVVTKADTSKPVKSVNTGGQTKTQKTLVPSSETAVLTKADTSKSVKSANAGGQTKTLKTLTPASFDSTKIIKTASVMKTELKKGNVPARGKKEITETGVASWIRDDDINPNKYFALHRSAPIGTIIKVTNKMNSKYVFVKVVGSLPDTGDNNDLLIKISKASAEKLDVRDSKFQSELSYSLTEKP